MSEVKENDNLSDAIVKESSKNQNIYQDTNLISTSISDPSTLKGELNIEISEHGNMLAITENLEDEISNFEGVECGCWRWGGKTLRLIIAIVMAFVSGLLFIANNFIIKVFRLSYGEMLTVRSIVQIPVMTFILFMKGEKILPTSVYHRIMLSLIGLFGSIIMLTSFICVKLMPVPYAITLMFTTPLFTIMFSALFLNDKVSWIKAISGLGLMSGIVQVTQPSFIFKGNNSILKEVVEKENVTKDVTQEVAKDIITEDTFLNDSDDHYFIGALVALSSAVFMGAIYVITTKIKKEVTSVLQLLYMAMFALFISGFLPFIDYTDHFFTSKMTDITPYDWGLYVAVSCSGIFGFWLALMACRMIDPAIVSTLRTTEIVVAFLGQNILTNVAPELLKVSGAAFIILAALALIFEKKLSTAYLNSNAKYFFRSQPLERKISQENN